MMNIVYGEGTSFSLRQPTAIGYLQDALAPFSLAHRMSPGIKSDFRAAVHQPK